ncbi:MAG: exodeoxyribonuclease VII large subunit [Ignavibacteriales bacterium]|nr:exodeoxyribonuclease VII large subunit [Ignavibacteriales bacterium]
MGSDSEQILTVIELTRRIKGVLELGFGDVWVMGEVSNCKYHTSGHIYFTLKDESAQISAVMWRSRATGLIFRLSDGMKVTVRGRITVYEPRGNYQIDCFQIQPAGRGELQLAFERLKQKLDAEGLFAEERKRPLPPFPQRIVIVTSPTGAAIRDLLSVIGRRYPCVEVVILPVRVQGIGSAEEIVRAILTANEHLEADVLIVGRGGGSLEDLWAFNEEIVARAIYNSRIPVVSAVGHEVDFTIADFVADLRAPTPSAAAELVVPERLELIESVDRSLVAATRALLRSVSDARHRIASLTGSRSFNRPIDLVHQRFQKIDDMTHRLVQALDHWYALSRRDVLSIAKRLESINPAAVLHRGYAIVRDDKGRALTSVTLLAQDQNITINFHDGDADAVVRTVHQS